MKHEAPTGPKTPADKQTPQKDQDGRSDRKPDAAGGEDSGKPSAEEVVNRQRNPVTNQEEQEKITNTGGDDIPMPEK